MLEHRHTLISKDAYGFRDLQDQTKGVITTGLTPSARMSKHLEKVNLGPLSLSQQRFHAVLYDTLAEFGVKINQYKVKLHKYDPNQVDIISDNGVVLWAKHSVRERWQIPDRSSWIIQNATPHTNCYLLFNREHPTDTRKDVLAKYKEVHDGRISKMEPVSIMDSRKFDALIRAMGGSV